MNISYQSFWAFYHSFRQALADVYQGDAGEADRVSQWLLEHETNTSWLQLRMHTHPDMTALQPFLAQKANRLLAGEPIQYVLGAAPFYGRSFYVTPDVLIPRGETEELMVWVRDELLTSSPPPKGWTLLDIGTGSGCIPISLWLELAQRGLPVKCEGMDISEPALEVARKNAKMMRANVAFRLLDVFEAAEDGFSGMDVIVSNPPYVPIAEKQSLAERVRLHEPPQALFVPDEQPLVFYHRIIERAEHWLKPGGKLFLEIHADFGKAVQEVFASETWGSVHLRQDLNGRNRMVKAQLNPS